VSSLWTTIRRWLGLSSRPQERPTGAVRRGPRAPAPGVWHCHDGGLYVFYEKIGTHDRSYDYHHPVSVITAAGEEVTLPNGDQWSEVAPGVFVQAEGGRSFVAVRPEAMPVKVRYLRAEGYYADDAPFDSDISRESRRWEDFALDPVPLTLGEDAAGTAAPPAGSAPPP
jgi:hypothetical protein